ncbi:MAG: hypothetical protein H0T56_17565 [Pseudaminobacter sp.]|nr:hypothetical protein [Pseudaminobacter sp.]
MKHQTIDQLQAIAEIHTEPLRPAMTRAQRLERWAELLEANPLRCLGTLSGTEHQSRAVRQNMRSPGSPIAIAFEDPLLRAEGLENDTYGEAKRFFEVTDWQLHDIVCHCHVGETMSAARAARYVRAVVGGRFSFFTRWRAAIFS